MDQQQLLPNRFKTPGWILLSLSLLTWIYVAVTGKEFSFLDVRTFALASTEVLGKTNYLSMAEVNLTNTLSGSLFITGGLLVAFSKEKVEDEFIAGLRLAAFQWAVLINYLLLLVMYLFVYGIDFLTVMLFNMFTVLALFLIRFYYLLIKNRGLNEK